MQNSYYISEITYNVHCHLTNLERENAKRWEAAIPPQSPPTFDWQPNKMAVAMYEYDGKEMKEAVSMPSLWLPCGPLTNSDVSSRMRRTGQKQLCKLGRDLGGMVAWAEPAVEGAGQHPLRHAGQLVRGLGGMGAWHSSYGLDRKQGKKERKKGQKAVIADRTREGKENWARNGALAVFG